MPSPPEMSAAFAAAQKSAGEQKRNLPNAARSTPSPVSADDDDDKPKIATLRAEKKKAEQRLVDSDQELLDLSVELEDWEKRAAAAEVYEKLIENYDDSIREGILQVVKRVTLEEAHIRLIKKSDK